MRIEDIDWDAWSPDLDATLLFIVRDGEILLIHKKRGLGAGKLNGAGGKVDPGETPIQAAEREFEEELRAQPVGTTKRGEVLFHVTDDDSIRIHVFVAGDCTGIPRETDEAVPRWVSVDEIPFHRMWEDDRYWLPHLVEGACFEIKTIFTGDRLLSHRLDLKPPGFMWPTTAPSA